jgi:hypothetical protein
MTEDPRDLAELNGALLLAAVLAVFGSGFLAGVFW